MNKLVAYLPVMAKALVAFATSGLGALGTAWADGSLTDAEKVTALGVAFAAMGVVWAVPNKPQS